jgi:hypothetical protein
MLPQTSLHTSTSLLYLRSESLQLATFSHLASALFGIFNFNVSKDSLNNILPPLCFPSNQNARPYSPLYPNFRISSPGLSFQTAEIYKALLPHNFVLPYLFTVKNLPLLPPLSINKFSLESSPYLDPFAFYIWPRLRTSHLLVSQSYFLLLTLSSVQTNGLRGSCNGMQ